MQEQTHRKFDQIRAILTQTAQQQAESVNAQRRLDLKLDRIAEKQERNAEAIDQLTQRLEQLRRSLVEEQLLMAQRRGEIAQPAKEAGAHDEAERPDRGA